MKYEIKLYLLKMLITTKNCSIFKTFDKLNDAFDNLDCVIAVTIE